MQVGLATTKQEFLKECEVAPGISQNEFARPGIVPDSPFFEGLRLTIERLCRK